MSKKARAGKDMVKLDDGTVCRRDKVVYVPRINNDGFYKTTDGKLYKKDPKTGSIRKVRI